MVQVGEEVDDSTVEMTTVWEQALPAGVEVLKAKRGRWTAVYVAPEGPTRRLGTAGGTLKRMLMAEVHPDDRRRAYDLIEVKVRRGVVYVRARAAEG